jgi:hypothetical protein
MFLGHLWIVVEAWQKGVLWGFGCLFPPGFPHLRGVELEASEERILPASLRINCGDDSGEYGQIRSKEKAQRRAAPFLKLQN